MSELEQLKLREVYACGKCGVLYKKEEIDTYLIPKEHPQDFKCRSCKKGDFWDLHHEVVDEQNRRMIFSKGKWYTEWEWSNTPRSEK